MEKVLTSRRTIMNIEYKNDNSGQYRLTLIDGNEYLADRLGDHFYVHTDNENLIKELTKFNVEEDIFEFGDEYFHFRSTTRDDIIAFMKSYNTMRNEPELAEEYITKANCKDSHLLLVEVFGETVGFIKYIVHQGQMVVKFYFSSNKNHIINPYVWQIFEKKMIEIHQVSQFEADVDKFDEKTIALHKAIGFVDSDKEDEEIELETDYKLVITTLIKKI
ncbi:hypothetical protein HF295_07115 [Hujiaoplasma nucleasis]|uniref:Uncharacterized protein n=1 Tax=Hujiaoplasma nucleasis TaxID=2725268 RepID=A0A7L6N6K7_9MOLU|nr:hypothetical protein [Hujiaoplasma nucleasis]QLY40625.1 hypothetical protein HF295_07115 [Hujiaoplasma nucleasis]